MPLLRWGIPSHDRDMTRANASLAACAAKLDWATEHLEALRAEQCSYLESAPLKTTSHFDAATSWWSFRACERISLRYSNIVGDCVHNLCSMLDQLVTHGAIASGQALEPRPLVTVRRCRGSA